MRTPRPVLRFAGLLAASFAAPALAGDIAHALGDDRGTDAGERSERARKAVAAALEAGTVHG